MYLKELLEKTQRKGQYDKYTLLVQHYGLLEGEHLEREYFTNTPIFDKYSGISEKKQKEYIVLIPFHKSIDIGRNWEYWDLQTIVVTTKEELLKHYSEKQTNEWLAWLDEIVRKEVFQKCL